MNKINEFIGVWTVVILLTLIVAITLPIWFPIEVYKWIKGKPNILRDCVFKKDWKAETEIGCGGQSYLTSDNRKQNELD